MDEIKNLQSLLADAEADAIKFFERGNASAGTRLRKTMQAVKKQANVVRLTVSDHKRAKQVDK